MEINKTVIVASRWFLYYLTYIDDARSNTNKDTRITSVKLILYILVVELLHGRHVSTSSRSSSGPNLQVVIPVAYSVCEVKPDNINHRICAHRGDFVSCDSIPLTC